MPSRPKKSKGVSFQLVQRSYEDQDYGEGPSHVWVKTSEIMKHTQRDVGRNQGPKRFKDPDADPYYFNEGEHDDDLEAMMAEMGVADDDALGIGSTAGGSGPDADLLAALAKKNMLEDYTNKRNMLMADDTREGDDDLFGDNAEEVDDFGQDFIQQMIYGDGGVEDEDDIRLRKAAAREARKKVRGEGEDEDEDDEEGEEFDDDFDLGEESEEEEIEYPKHDTTGSVIDRQFDRMLREFEVDATLNNHEVIDARVQGALQVEQYAPLLEEFADDHAQTSYVTDEHLHHRGLINGLRKLTRENRVFDTDEKGMFFTGALPDKATRLRQVFRDEADINRENTLKLIQREEEAIILRMARGMKPEEADAAPKITKGPPKVKAQFDAETILTTMSTLYNHPNVIGARKKRLDPTQALKAQQAEMRARHLQQSQQHKREVEEEADAAEEEDDDEEGVTLDISERPADETPEEKKLRRQLIKQLQREKRQQKKELTTAYKSASIQQKAKSGEKKAQKAQMTLSMAARV